MSSDSTIQQLLEQGVAHYRANQFPAAEAALRRVLATEPMNPIALAYLGMMAILFGNNESARVLLERSLAASGPRADTYVSLGLALCNLAKYDAAIDVLRSAIRMQPGNDAAHNNLGNALKGQGNLAAAEESYRAAIQANPHAPEAYGNLASLLLGQRRLDEAFSAAEEAIRLHPAFAQALNVRGAVLREKRRTNEAIASLQAALQANPNYADAYLNIGNAYQDLHQLDNAIAAYQEVIRLRSNDWGSHQGLALVLQESGMMENAIAYLRRAMELSPDDAALRSNLIYYLHFAESTADDTAINEQHQQWREQYAAPLRLRIQPHLNDRDPERKLRIGYVSPDFFHQAESFFVMPLLEAHDHNQVQVVCYSSVSKPDDVTARFKKTAAEWHDVQSLDNSSLAQRIREDRIDVLMDLTMHMGGNRLLLFAEKPAPVQFSWLAYPGSTGLDTIDYRLTDGFMEPAGQNDSWSAETPIRLPDCWCCYHPLTDQPEVNALPALQSGKITFASLNSSCKHGETVWRLWAEVLRAVPQSTLYFLTREGSHRELMRQFFQSESVDPERILFTEPLSRAEYLRFYHRIDIALDPFPYNGITTTCDALWMGVPVITIAGRVPRSRAGLSVITNAGMPEFIMDSHEGFVRRVCELSSDLGKLAEIRASLRARMEHSPLMDANRFARNVESAYRMAWRNWCNSGSK